MPAERAQEVQVTRLSNFALEVTVDAPDRPWRVAHGVFNKRRDAERHARALAAQHPEEGSSDAG